MESALRQKAVTKLRKMAMVPPVAQGVAKAIPGVMGALPGVAKAGLGAAGKALPVIGNIWSGASGVSNLAQGNIGSAALDFAGMLPGIGNSIQLARAGYIAGKALQPPQQPQRPADMKMASAPLAGFDKASLRDRGFAFEAGVEVFCKEAGFDDEDRAALYKLMLKQSEGWWSHGFNTLGNLFSGNYGGAASEGAQAFQASQAAPLHAPAPTTPTFGDTLRGIDPRESVARQKAEGPAGVAAERMQMIRDPQSFASGENGKLQAENAVTEAREMADISRKNDIRARRHREMLFRHQDYAKKIGINQQQKPGGFGTGNPMQAQLHGKMPTPETVNAAPTNGGYFTGAPPLAGGSIAAPDTPHAPPSPAPGGVVPGASAAAEMPPSNGTAPKPSPTGSASA